MKEEDGKLEVNANGVIYARRLSAANKKTARKTASMAILAKLKKHKLHRGEPHSGV